jgi:O-antigen ligase
MRWNALQFESRPQLLGLLARVFLIAYAIVLPIKKTAALQSGFLLTAFALLIWDQRRELSKVFRQALDILAPLLIFSLWIFIVCWFWGKPDRPWDRGLDEVQQPWFSLDLWRRDIGQPMIAILCGFWAFRDSKWKTWLFRAQCLFIFSLLIPCYQQYYVGWTLDNLQGKGTLFISGFSHDPIFFSYVLILLTPGVLWLILSKDSKKRDQLLGIVTLLVLFFLIYVNKRRGTWIAVYGEIFVLLWWFRRRWIVGYVIGTLVCGLIAFQLRPQWFYRSYDTSAQRQHGVGRLKIYSDAIPLMDDHPWIGVGFGKQTIIKNYWVAIYQHAHNTFANMALGVGFPGLALWIGALWAYAVGFWRSALDDWGSRIGFAFLIGFCLRNLTDDLWISSNAELFWFSLGVLMPNPKPHNP